MAKRLIGLVFLLAAAGWPQNVVSVMAGYLYQVEGEARIEGKAIAPKPQDLLHLRDGQRLETGDGRVEMMISPGSYLRVGPKSEVEMLDAGLLSVKLHLLTGVVIVDVSSLDQKGAIVIRVGDQGRVEPLSAGVFRIDAPAGGPARVRALEGKAAVFAAGSEWAVKKGREIGLAAGASPVKTEAAPDAIDQWQDERHRLLENDAKQRKGKHPRGLDPLDAEMLDMSTRRPG